MPPNGICMRSNTHDESIMHVIYVNEDVCEH